MMYWVECMSLLIAVHEIDQPEPACPMFIVPALNIMRAMSTITVSLFSSKLERETACLKSPAAISSLRSAQLAASAFIQVVAQGVSGSYHSFTT